MNPLISVSLFQADLIMTDTLTICALSALVSALSGVAALMRTEPAWTYGKLWMVVMNSGLLGLGLSLVWWESFSTNPNVLVGICILIGLGGQPMLEVILSLLQKGALRIAMKDQSLKVDDEEKKESPK